jgi:hypothetical protein
MAPSLLLAGPAMSLLAAWGVTSAAIGFASCGATGVLAIVLSEQIADMGRSLQIELFTRWGGSPTTVALRLSNSPNLAVTERRREAVEHATGRSLPTEQNELADLDSAMTDYDLALDQVRASLRENDANRILADVNANYGFRRNSLAVRNIGRVMSTFGVVVALALWILGVTKSPTSFLVAALINALLAAFWWVLVAEAWVQRDADRYATQFFTTLLKPPAA